ncbi:MAG: SUMF1/EgtB/PvdO family nonheme iron enzyme [Saprospiraceae bacterium]
MKIIITQTKKTVDFTNRIKAQFEQVESIDLDSQLNRLMPQVNEADALIIPIDKEHLKLIKKSDWEVLKIKHQKKTLQVLPVIMEDTSWSYMPYAAVFPIFPNDKSNLTESNVESVLNDINSYLASVKSPIETDNKVEQLSTPTKQSSILSTKIGHSQTNALLAKANDAETKGNLKNAIEYYKDMLHITTDEAIITQYKNKIEQLENKIKLNSWINQGRNAYKKGDFDTAVKAFKEATAIENSEKLQKTIKKIESRLRRKKIDDNIRDTKRTKWFAVLGAIVFAVGILFLIRYLNRPKPILVDMKVIEDGYPMVLVKGKTFKMGTNAYDDQKPLHEVTLDDYYIGKYEITVELYDAYCQDQGLEFVNLSTGNLRGKTAMTHVSWFNACQFANWLSKKEGYSATYIISSNRVIIDSKANGYRLPTEAQWEFAAIGGREVKKYRYAGGNYMNDVSWNGENSQGEVHLVGQQKPNELGLYDMSGNVWEWCWDWHKTGYEGHGSLNPTGPDFGSNKVMRGGSWFSEDYYLRPRTRTMDLPTTRDVDLGFRLVRPK